MADEHTDYMLTAHHYAVRLLTSAIIWGHKPPPAPAVAVVAHHALGKQEQLLSVASVAAPPPPPTLNIPTDTAGAGGGVGGGADGGAGSVDVHLHQAEVIDLKVADTASKPVPSHPPLPDTLAGWAE
jgi:hypothetical protein